MPLYRCKYITGSGEKSSKIVEADSFEEAKSRLVKEKILVLELTSYKKHSEKVYLNRSSLISFTRELGQLLKAGLPLYESLVTIEEKNKSSKNHQLFLDFCDQLKSGVALSSIMASYPSSFDEVVISIVQAAEKTGDLAEGILEITRLLEYQQQLRRKLFETLSYPLLLGGFCLVVFICLMFFVVPTVRDLFQDTAQHPITKIVFGLSAFLQEYGLHLLLFIIALFSGLYILSRQPRFKLEVQRLILKFAFLRKIILHSALIIFCRTIAVLVAGGIPLVESLKLTAHGIKYLPLKNAMEEVQKRILEGKSFSEELARFPFIPSLVIRMASIAEKTGKFSEMMASCAMIFQEELDRDLKRLTTLLQPVLLITLGLVVGFVLLSILIPITDVSSMLNV